MSTKYAYSRRQLRDQMVYNFEHVCKRNDMIYRSCGCRAYRSNLCRHIRKPNYIQPYKNVLPDTTGDVYTIKTGTNSVIVCTTENCTITEENGIRRYLPTDEDRVMLINGVPVKYIFRTTFRDGTRYLMH